MKYRLRFSKYDLIRFIGHLDLMRVFQRAIRRANLPIAYSQGFNPHQILSFALPLSLGMTSQGEYIDLEMKELIDPTEITVALNKTLPEGLRIISTITLQPNYPSAMAQVEGAQYKVKLEPFVQLLDLSLLIDQFLQQQELWIEKKTKKQQKLVNIREDIHHIELVRENTETFLLIMLSAGSKQNLKPELVMQSMYQIFQWEYNPYTLKYHRIDLFGCSESKFISLEHY